MVQHLLCVSYSYPEEYSSEQALLGIYILEILIEWQLKADTVSTFVPLISQNQPVCDQHILGN